MQGELRIVGRCCYCYQTIVAIRRGYSIGYYALDTEGIAYCYLLLHCLERGDCSEDRVGSKVPGRSVYYCSVECLQRRPLDAMIASSRQTTERGQCREGGVIVTLNKRLRELLYPAYWRQWQRTLRTISASLYGVSMCRLLIKRMISRG